MDANAFAAFVFVLILLLSVLGAHWIHTKHIKYATEGSLALLLGFAITGLICGTYYAAHKQPLPAHWIRFNDTLIFEVLLPPIIFYAGFSLKKKLFFQNFATIFTYGFLGTLATTAMVSIIAAAGLQLIGMGGQSTTTALAIGTIASCSDTVGILQVVDRRSYPVLYSLVFGEGIMNDAVSIVLLGAVAQLAKQQQVPNTPSKRRPGATTPAAASAAVAGQQQQGRSSMLAVPFNPVRPARTLLGQGLSLFGPSAALPGTHSNRSTSDAVVSVASTSQLPPPAAGVQPSHFPGNMFGDGSDHTGWVTLGEGLQLMGDFLWLGLTSAALGVAAGLGSALLMKHVFKHSRHDCDREALLLGLMGLAAYMAAAAAELSAVLAVFFAGLTMSHYTWHSMSPAGRSLALHSFRVVSGLMELTLYAYSGVDMWTIALLQQERTWGWSAARASALALVLLVAITMARLAFVLPASAAANVLWRRWNTLSPSDIAVVAWAGLSRGAITLALGYHYFLTAAQGGSSTGSQPSADSQVVLLALVLLVLISTAVLGACTRPVMEVLLGRNKARHAVNPQQQAALQRDLEPDNDPLQAEDQLANSSPLPLVLPPPPAPAAALSVAAAAAGEPAAEEGGLWNDAARSRLRSWLKAASTNQGLSAPLLHHTWSTCSVESSTQQDAASWAAAAGSHAPYPLSSRASMAGSEGPGRPPVPPVSQAAAAGGGGAAAAAGGGGAVAAAAAAGGGGAAAAAGAGRPPLHPAPPAPAAAAPVVEGGSPHSGSAVHGPAAENTPPPSATAAAAAAAQGEEEARWSVPLSSLLQHTDSSSTLTAPAHLRWLSERAYSMNGEPVPLLPPRALEEISAWLSHQLSQPGTAASSMAGTAVHAPIREAASAPSLLVTGTGGEAGAGGVEVVAQERGGLHRLWQQLDRRWLQPWFGGRHGHHHPRHHHAS